MKKVFCTHEIKGRSLRTVIDRWSVGRQSWQEVLCSGCGRIWRDMK